jgi:hypothetical protein
VKDYFGVAFEEQFQRGGELGREEDLPFLWLLRRADSTHLLS